MNSTRVVTQQTVAELIGNKTYRPLISVRLEQHQADQAEESPVLQGIALYRKSLQIIPSGPYRLRFIVNGAGQEYSVRVENKNLLLAGDEKAA